MKSFLLPVTVMIISASPLLPQKVASRPSARRSVSGITVPLTRVVDTAPSPMGLTNIFFEAPTPEIQRTMRAREDWTAIEVADVVKGDGLKTIYAARFKTPGSDQLHYVVDTAGNLDFSHGQPLIFAAWPHISVANLVLDVHTTRGAHRRIPYQVSFSDDGYTYARIAEYLTGRMRFEGQDYGVKVRSSDRNEPFYGTGTGTVLLIDLDGNGEIAEKPTITLGGEPASAEQVLASTPFMLAKHAWRVAVVDSMGSSLVIRQTKATVAAAENFKAPAIVARTLSGENYRLSKSRGVVLIEFWSVSCGFCEKARPAGNELAEAQHGHGFTWLAVAKESDRAEIARFLATHPMRATIAVYDSAAWKTYDPIGLTPLYIVVDKSGVIRYRGTGASAIEPVSATVRKLLAP